MFTWWKRNFATAPSPRRYLPRLESLEQRETPAVAIGVGNNVNISMASGNQREQTIVINPTNPNNVVAFSNIDSIDGDLMADSGIFEAYSFDGGQTWAQQLLFTDTTSPDEACCDPQAAFDRFGNLFFTYLTNSGDIALARSNDGGQSFFISLLTFDTGHDQPSIAVGPGPKPGLGSVWVSYFTSGVNPGLPPHIDTQVAVVAGFGLVGPFKNPVAVPGSELTRSNFGDIAIGPNGEAVVTYHSTVGNPAGPSIIFMNVDPDGMGPAPWSSRRFVTSTNIGFARIIPGTSNNLGIGPEPSVAFDRSKGRFRGRLYLAYTDAANTTTNDTNVVVRYSTNLGLTWSGPVQVHDVTAGSQFNPAIAVDPITGLVGLGWFDTRNDSTGARYEFFATISDTGGNSYSPNAKVSAGQSQSSLSETPPIAGLRPLGVGDYNKIDFYAGNLQVIWPDNSPGLVGNPDPGHMELVTARLKVGKSLRVKVIFPPRWRLVDAANGIFQGRITVVNTSGINLQGPFKLTITLPHPSLNFVFPPNTRVGNTVTFTINSGLPNRRALRFLAQLANPLRLPLPSALAGFASSIV